ncbi:MAG TPA: hypothetical protein VIL30_23560, partial [Ramlibacter sp.]
MGRDNFTENAAVDNDSHGFIEQALAQARLSVGLSEPNPRVGCVLVAADGRQVLGVGCTQA